VIDELMENIAYKDRTIAQLLDEKMTLIADYMAHERLIAEQDAELTRLRAVNAVLVEVLKAGLELMPLGTAKRADWLVKAGNIISLSRAEQAKPETCRWTELENGIFVGCGHNYFSSDFRYRLQNPAKEAFCPVCGKRIEVAGKAEGREE
jgi:hypothetical protein